MKSVQGLLAMCLISSAASAAVLEPGKVEVYAGSYRSAGTVAFAVEELTNALGQAFGVVPTVLTKAPAAAPTDGTVRFYLGEAAGLETANLPRDAFRVRVAGDEIRIAGRDDLKARMFGGFAECATVHGVYEFLERYLGVRYYFPGELGTIIPRQTRVTVADADFTVKPDYTVRYSSTHDAGELYASCPTNDARGKRFAVALQDRRLRMRTTVIPCCHGIAGPHYPARFAKTHPEYFLLQKNGQRLLDDEPVKPPRSRAPHFCYTSGLWDEIYADAKSYLTGEGPEVRGVLRGRGTDLKCEWGRWCSDRKYYDVMPNDSFQPCQCAACQAAYDHTKANYATELIWSKTAELARRLSDEGVPGTITQMAYFPYNDVPTCEIPTNVAVMVAETGPWSLANPAVLEKQNATIRAWAEKTHGSVWLWTYVGKYGRLDLPDIPLTTPRAFAKYYKMVAPWIFGAYAESKTDRYLYHYLDLYVFAKLSWNLDVDVEALLAEHDRLMFGPAAAEMGAFFREIENLWLRITGNVVVTPLGPLSRPPTEHVLWTEIYNRETMAALRGYLDRAAACVAPGSLEARRIALIRDEYYEKMAAKSIAYCTLADVPAHRAYKAANRARLKSITDFRLSKPGHGTLEKIGENHWRISPTASLGEDGYAGGRTDAFVRGLKPGCRYRISYFVSCRDVASVNKPGNNGGFLTVVKSSQKEGVRHWPVPNYFSGTQDWVHHAETFTADESGSASVSFFLWAVAMGSAEFEDVTIEEIGE